MQCSYSLDLYIKDFGSSRSSGVLETESPDHSPCRNWNFMLQHVNRWQHVNYWHHDRITRHTLAPYIICLQSSRREVFSLRALNVYFSQTPFHLLNPFQEPAETARVSSCRWYTIHYTKRITKHMMLKFQVLFWALSLFAMTLVVGKWIKFNNLADNPCYVIANANEVWLFVGSCFWLI